MRQAIPGITLACAVSLVAGQAGSPETVIALVGARVYADPAAIPVDDAVVVLTGQRITAVGTRKAVPVPPGATAIDAAGLVVLAGFQNSHVHFTDDSRWGGAASRPAATLEASLREMVTRYGYTTVVDLASFPDNTKALRRRVDSGEIAGPRILTAGAALYPPEGVPYYVRDTLPAAVVATLPQPATPAAAAQLVRTQLEGGADAVKLFTGAWVTRGRVLPMPADIAAAATAVAREKGRPVFAHPSNYWVFPVVIGSGKRLFADGAIPTGLKLVDSKVSTTGVVMGRYEPAGEIPIGSFE